MPRDNVRALLDPLVILYAYKRHISLLHSIVNHALKRSSWDHQCRGRAVMVDLTVRTLSRTMQCQRKRTPLRYKGLSGPSHTAMSVTTVMCMRPIRFRWGKPKLRVSSRWAIGTAEQVTKRKLHKKNCKLTACWRSKDWRKYAAMCRTGKSYEVTGDACQSRWCATVADTSATRQQRTLPEPSTVKST